MGSFFDWLVYYIVDFILMVIEAMETNMIKKIFCAFMFVLQAATAGIFFHAAKFNHLPAPIAKSAWMLGGCCAAFAVFMAVEIFIPRRKRRDSPIS